jgi:hypothetical protein
MNDVMNDYGLPTYTFALPPTQQMDSDRWQAAELLCFELQVFDVNQYLEPQCLQEVIS